MLYKPQLTSVGVEADGGMEPLACLEHVQGQGHLRAVPLLVDLIQSVLQVEPEASLLESRPRGGITLESGHLRGGERERERGGGGEGGKRHSKSS